MTTIQSLNWDEFIVLCPQSIAKTNLLGRIDFVGSGNKSNTARDIEGERPSLAISRPKIGPELMKRPHPLVFLIDYQSGAVAVAVHYKSVNRI